MRQDWPIRFLPVLVLAAALTSGGCDDEAAIPIIPPPYFDTFPVAEADYVSIVPLGNLNPSGHTLPTDHFYIYLRIDGGTGLPVVTPVLAPGNIVITDVESSEHVTAGFTDYGLHFTVPGNSLFRGRFGHMYDLSPAMNAALASVTPTCETYDTGGETFTQCRYSTSIAAAAGDPLGNAGGRAGQWALDFFAYDHSRPPSAYANPSRYTDSGLPYAVCALDYYTDATRIPLEAKLGNYDGSVQRTAPPVCGQVNQDVPGTAQGNWFRQGFPDLYPEDNHLALVHDNVDPTVPVFSVGVQAGTLASGTYTYTPVAAGPVNRQFSDITADSQTYCIEPAGLSPLVVLLHMPDSQTLHLEAQSLGSCGSGPWTLSGTPAVYLR